MNLVKIKKIKTILVYFSRVVLDIVKVFWYCIKNIVKKRKLFDDNLTIVTGSDFTHFQSIKNLLHSILKHEVNSKIIVYDLGLPVLELPLISFILAGVMYSKGYFTELDNM